MHTIFIKHTRSRAQGGCLSTLSTPPGYAPVLGIIQITTTARVLLCALQDIVDADNCFLGVCIGWPGSVHDTRVFVHSPIYSLITEKVLLPNKPVSINGVNVPLFLTGDSVYPLQTWLMKPFPQSGVLTNEEKQCNYRMSRACIVVENVYGRLKARW